MKILKITLKCTVRKKFQSRNFNFFFYANCHKVIPYKVSKVKKQKNYSMYVLNKIKKHIFTSK
jgi:hypothetical protein